MKLTLAHFKAETLELLRMPAYLIPSMLFPAMFFLFFVAPNADTLEAANTMLAGYLVFATLGVVFFQFGVGIASDRISPWTVYQRTLPLPPSARIAARILTALAFAAAACAVLIVVAYIATPARISGEAWLRLLPALLAGAIPASLMGIALGYLAAPKAAVPLANLFYLPLSFLGGLWVPPQFLPELVQRISVFLPTRQWAEVVWPAVLGRPWEAAPWLALLGFTVVFGLLAVWGYRRDQGQRFS